jgi:hypothetical protein
VIRFAWLQFRMQAAVAAAMLAIVAVVLGVSGPHLVHLYDTTVANCGTRHDCSTAMMALTHTDTPLQIFMHAFVLLVPLLIGMFWGAPLISREFETRSFRLAWTQSVTRTRWLTVKLGLGAVWAMVAGGLTSLMANWWANPIDTVNQDRFSSFNFGFHGIVPIGYAAFAFVLGVTTGVALRRTVPAMAITLVGFVGVRLAATYWLRPHLVAPAHEALAIDVAKQGTGIVLTPSGLALIPPDVKIPNGWVNSTAIVDRAGHALTPQFFQSACPSLNGIAGNGQPPVKQDFQNCLSIVASKFYEVVTFQPATRFWQFQWYEFAIFIGLAIVLGGLSFWWIRRPAS